MDITSNDGNNVKTQRCKKINNKKDLLRKRQ